MPTGKRKTQDRRKLERRTGKRGVNVRYEDIDPTSVKRIKRGRQMKVEVMNPYAPIITGMLLTMGTKTYRVLEASSNGDEQHLTVEPAKF